MALPLANTFEGGSNGTAITVANSGGASGDAFTAITGTAPAPVFSTTAMHGSLALAVIQPVSSAPCYCEWGSTVIPAGARVYGRSYLRFTTLPAGAANHIIRFLNSGTVMASIGISPSPAGAIQGYGSGTSGSTAVGTASSVLAINTWYRLEWDITSGNIGQFLCNVYTGDSTTLLTSASGSGAMGAAGLINTMVVGDATGVTASTSYFFDDIQVNATGLPGPAPVPQPQRPTIVSQAVNRAAMFMKSRQFEAQRFRPVFAGV